MGRLRRGVRPGHRLRLARQRENQPAARRAHRPCRGATTPRCSTRTPTSARATA
nr:MAG TPA: hypothetical protein [Caudoviricetes sp.]